MKISLLLLSLISFSFSLFAQDNNSQVLLNKELKKYPIENAKITYAITGDASGTAVRCFVDFGWKENFEQNLTLEKYGIREQTLKRSIILGDYAYIIKDSVISSKEKDARFSELLSYKSQRETIDALMKIKGGTKMGMETILDKECNLWVFKTGTIKEIYEWEGIPLKIVKKLPGINYSIVAENIDNESPITDSNFDLPTKMKN